MDEIKKGDVVQLKSGGPLMTVIEIWNDEGVPTATCVWFEKATRDGANFPLFALAKE